MGSQRKNVIKRDCFTIKQRLVSAGGRGADGAAALRPQQVAAKSQPVAALGVASFRQTRRNFFALDALSIGS
jgi:hypothetical protein